MAVAPAVLLAALSLKLNHFALIDDWVNLVQASAGFRDNLAIHDSGRVNFFYRLFHWAVIRVLAPEAWALSLANGACVVVGAFQVHRLATRGLGGALPGGVAAAWLFTLNTATAEGLFSLGKTEPKQLVCWLLVLALLVRALRPGAPGRAATAALMGGVATAAAFLFKETAVLLAVPLGLLALMTARAWPRLTTHERRRRAGLLAACAIPLAAGTTLIVAYGLRAESYPRQLMSGPVGLTHLDVLAQTDAGLAAMVTAALLLGTVTALRSRHGPVLLLTAQLGAVAGFYTLLRTTGPYSYYPAAAMAAVVLGRVLFPPGERHVVARRVAGAVAVVLVAYGGVRALSGGLALGGWSWLYDRLVSVVGAERPPRVMFYRSGGWEVYVEAKLVWETLRGLPVVTGVLDPAEAPGEGVRRFGSRDLRPGDWILEQFGAARNARVPFRDLNVTRREDHALAGLGGEGLLPARVAHRYVARYGWPAGKLDLWPGSTWLEWRVYEVTAAPCVVLEDLAADHWMGERAGLWVRRGGWERVILRIRPFVASVDGRTFQNQLDIRQGETAVARCPVRGAASPPCVLEASAFRLPGDGQWTRLDLIAEKVFVPRALGIGRETRSLSFSFRPTWEAGHAALLEGGRAGRACDGGA